MKADLIEQAYVIARKRYAAIGVDTDAALSSLHQQTVTLQGTFDGLTAADREFLNSLVGGKRPAVAFSGEGSAKNIWECVAEARAMQRHMLQTLLSPSQLLSEYEANGQQHELQALTEEVKSMPLGAVFDYFNLKSNVPVGEEYIACISQHEAGAAARR